MSQLALLLPTSSIELPVGCHLRTLTDPIAGHFKEFDRDYFCDRAADDTPMTCEHTLYLPNGLWIGQVFREFEDEPWQIRLRDSEAVRGVWDAIEQAVSALLEWEEQRQQEILEWRRSVGLLSSSR